MHTIDTTSDDFCTPPKGIPERGLLAGILERAHRDLTDIEMDKIKQAIKWFESWRTGFGSYHYVASALSLSASDVLFLKKAVKRAKKFAALNKIP